LPRGLLPGIHLGLADPLAQRLRRRDAKLRRDRPDRRILGVILAMVLGHEPHRALPQSLKYCFGMKIILSRKEVSIEAGAVQNDGRSYPAT
jgi:hypothetical protein